MHLAVCVGADACVGFELFVEPVDFDVAYFVSDFINSKPGMLQKKLGFFHTLLKEIFVKRHVFVIFELLAQIGAIEMHARRYFL
ncbi:hypothetical protein D3C78_1828110 [compost metagenome]